MSEFWKIDTERRTATHTLTGMVVKFTHQADGKIDRRLVSPLPAGVGIDNAAHYMREAGDAYLEAMLGDIQ